MEAAVVICLASRLRNISSFILRLIELIITILLRVEYTVSLSRISLKFSVFWVLIFYVCEIFAIFADIFWMEH